MLAFAGILTLVVGVFATSAYAMVDHWLEDLPDISNADIFNNAEKTRVYANDRTTLIAEFYLEDRIPVDASQVSPYMFNATVDIEDERFWTHNGIDPYGIVRAAVNDLLGGGLQGASTITQQLVRQTVLSAEANDITIERKVREAYLAVKMEEMYSKETVLMMYLNTINYGDGTRGVESAAQHYFSKSAGDLTLPEAALLAGIPQQPTGNNPVLYPDAALKRRNQVLDRMLVNGDITEEECTAAKASDLGLNIKERSEDGIYRVPYFSSYVRGVLQGQQGIHIQSDLENTDLNVFSAGLTVYTTIDLAMQEQAEQVCAEKEATLDSDVEVSLCTVDPNTGEIKVMRGGKDYYGESQFNTCTQMVRQPGSTFKMFALVALLEMGVSPSTTVSGKSPLYMQGWPDGVSNYGGQNMGNMSIATATAVSSNTAFARVVRAIGPAPVADVAHRMGIESNLELVNSIVLGSQGVNTLEMASAYGTLAVAGKHYDPVCITQIIDNKGNTIYQYDPATHGEQVITPEVAYAATNVLEGVVTGGTATSARLSGQVSAGKTGTSENYTDSWYCGYTPQLSTAIWIGSREQRSIPDNAGGSNCCPVWRNFMAMALDGVPSADFPEGTNPTYTNKIEFVTAAEKAEAEEEAKKKEEEEKAKEGEEGGTGNGTGTGDGTGTGSGTGNGSGSGTTPTNPTNPPTTPTTPTNPTTPATPATPSP
jgi:penicillin-binding protein 1A